MRLFGSMMSGAIVLSITPFVLPIVMTVLGMLTGMVQAYIFTILATVYGGKAKPKQAPVSAAGAP